MEKLERPIKVLVWADSPACATGFATVSREIFTPLARSGFFDIDVIGINEGGGWHDPNEYPFRIFPARHANATAGDYHGRDRLVMALQGKERGLTPPWDILWTLNDPFILEQPIPVFNTGTLHVINEIQKKALETKPDWYFSTVSYWPIDSELKPNWISDAISLSNLPIAYTNYGKEEIVKAGQMCEPPIDMSNMEVIYHGVNLDAFHVVDEKEISGFRQGLFGDRVRNDTFLIMAVARNQPRKDLPRVLQIYSEFKKRRPDSYLYMHCKAQDVGGSLLEFSKWFNLKPGDDWGFPSKFSENMGVPVEVLNKLYNISDCVISASLGEGFGLPYVEAMATKTINLAPHNTTVPELFGLDSVEENWAGGGAKEGVRGVSYASGSTSSEWTNLGATDYERIRPVGNVDDAVEKLLWIYDNPDEVEKIEENAYKWVQTIQWKDIATKWGEVIYGAFLATQEVREKQIKKNEVKEKKDQALKDKKKQARERKK